MNLYEELKWRGLIDNITDEKLIDELNNGELTFYIGTDPTGDSLHIGHFSSLLVAKRLKDAGHHPIMLVGGATGFIGDPKATGERNMLTKETLNYNYNCLNNQIKELFGFEMVNNFDWISKMSVIDFLRDIGKFFNINYMLSKETVKRRLESGISYTEFSYMLLQGMDFLHLYEEKNCTLQIGGQDQWGNITTGLELIRKKHGADINCYGMTMPLITKADGTKFGKSEKGNVWLNKEKTTPYEMYQFLINSEDEKVIDYLKKLTFLEKEEIEILEEKVKNEPYKREAQKALAKEVITFLHGENEYKKALKISDCLFKGNIMELSDDELREAISGFEKISTNKNFNLVDILVDTKIAKSKREAREWILNNSISVNGTKVSDCNFIFDKNSILVDNCVFIKRGKKNYYVVELN